VIRAHRDGATVLGICGGYQLMGTEVLDPDHVEGEIACLPGLGLLPISTSMTGEKITRQNRFRLTGEVEAPWMEGYEIHMGSTRVVEGEIRPLAVFEDGHIDGYLVDETCMGTYIHGILDNPRFIDFLLKRFACKIEEAGKPFDYHAFKEEQYNKLADHVRSHVNMDLVYKILQADD